MATIRDLRRDCAVRRAWIKSGRWDYHPTAIRDWRAEIEATERAIARMEEDARHGRDETG